MKIFSMRDNQAEAFNTPFFRATEGVAIREITTHISKDEIMSAHPVDFSLYNIGTFDTVSGRLTPCDPKHVIDMTELAESIEKKDD